MAQTYSFRLTAEGWDAFARDMQNLGQQSDVAQRALDRLRQASPALQTAMERAEQQVERTTQALTRHATANDNAATSTGRVSQVIGQAGFQIQDFAVQVQGGTSALTALSQQGSQFLGLFGAGGAIAGAVLTVGILAAQLLKIGDNAEEAAKRAEASFKGMAEQQEALSKALEDVNKLWRNQAENAVAAEQASRRALGSILSLSADQLVQRNEGNALELTQARKELAEAEAARARRDANASPFNPLSRQSPRVQQEEEARLFALRARVEGLEADIGRVSTRIGEVAEARRRLETAPPPGADEFGPGRDEFRESQRILREQQRGSRGSTREAPLYGPTRDDFVRSQQILDREEAQRQKAIDDSIRKEEEARQRSYERDVQRYSTMLSTGVTDALFDGFKNGESAVATLGNALQRALRTAVAASLDSEVFRPLIGSLLGSFRGSSFAGPAGGGGSVLSLTRAGDASLTGPAGNSFSLSDLLSGGKSAASFLDGGFSGLVNAANPGNLSFLQGTGVGSLLNTTVFGGAAQASATNAALAGLGGAYGPATPAAVSAAGGSLTGVATIGSVLGAAGLGFGAGSLAGTLTSSIRGTTGPGGTIGAGAGTLAGIALAAAGLGPLAPLAIIGGLLGGAGGGLFGPTKAGLAARTGGQANYGIGADGLLTINALGGKRIDEGAFREDIQGQIDEVNSAISSRGLRFSGNTQLSVGTGKAAGSLPQDIEPGRFVQYLRSDNSNVQTGLDALRNRNNTDFNTVLTSVDFIQKVYEPLLKAPEAADRFQEEFDRLTRTFDDAADRARELGLATDELAAARDRERQKVTDERDRQRSVIFDNITGREAALRGDTLTGTLLSFDAAARQEVTGATDSLKALGVTADALAATVARLQAVQAGERQSLIDADARARQVDPAGALRNQIAGLNTIGGAQSNLLSLISEADGSVSPEARLRAAQGAFGAAVTNARQAGLRSADLSAVNSAGRALLDAGRAFYGGGIEGAGLVNFVRSTANSLGTDLDLPAWGGSLDRAVAETRANTDEMGMLRGEISRLREEIQTQRIRGQAA